ncbi:hypothetical protein GCM10027160_39480 [Streptomyces calidiresistens]|uniref:Zinc ribbon domain-containing protein n=1 Tax=Streptomyces calidiresistens TaxID=1485586 RepID=A0A7W3T2K6_9ACTN|nr:zinc ribbon domain-containing protein [Streptomyces calidiresistens]MBB0229633.1 zinc ribbon domain-containing protein [Streptomyces calidiresistens]
MNEISFSRNHRDLSRSSGADAGFQFEFHCTRCRDAWRSPFEPYASGRAADWLRRGAGMLGQVLGGSNGHHVSRAADGFADAGWGKARDEAFQRAIDSAERNFNRCPKCVGQLCGTCWNPGLGLCLGCAPDTATEVSVARHQGLNREASRRASEVGEARAASWDVETEHTLVCPRCSTEARGGRFCHGCGYQLELKPTCAGCSAELPQGAAFCPGCGRPAG